MLTRVPTSILIILVILPIGIFGGIWGPAALFAVMAAVSVFEMLSCCGLLKKWYVSIPSILGTAACVLLPAIFNTRIIVPVIMYIAVIPVVLVYFLFVAVICHKTIAVDRILMFFALVVYINAGFIALTVLSTVRPIFGFWTLVLVFAISWITDTFAYFSGMLFGKRKLCPDISPKKTVAGAIGGTIFGTLAGVVVFWIFKGMPLWGLIALPLSIVSQLGDLAASVIKRHMGVKDYGKLFPGHGGMLDRLDSIIPTSITTAMLLISIVVIFNYLKTGLLGF